MASRPRRPDPRDCPKGRCAPRLPVVVPFLVFRNRPWRWRLQYSLDRDLVGHKWARYAHTNRLVTSLATSSTYD
jgi:hypothetical protein